MVLLLLNTMKSYIRDKNLVLEIPAEEIQELTSRLGTVKLVIKDERGKDEILDQYIDLLMEAKKS